MTPFPEFIFQIIDSLKPLRYMLPIKKHPLKDETLYNPFFIIGSGRSGNTLLRRLLNRHPDIIIPPETYVLGSMIRRYRQHKGMKWNDLIDYSFSTLQFYPEFETFNISIGPLVNKLKIEPAENRNLAYILNSFYLYYASEVGKNCRRWGDKTPINTFYLDRIRSIFPDARFVNMIRDGYDAVASYVNAGIYTDYEQAAKRWSVSIHLINKFKKKYPTAVLDVYYEKLVLDPRPSLEKICEFINLNFIPQLLDEINLNSTSLGDVEVRSHHANVLNPINTYSIGKGRRSLTMTEKDRIRPIIEEQMSSLGYEIEGVQNFVSVK